MSQANKIIQFPIKPNIPEHIGQMLSSEHLADWTDAIFENHDKLLMTNTFSCPLLIKHA